MQVIREVRKVIDHQVIINLPKNFKEKEIEILILPARRETRGAVENAVEMGVIKALKEVKMMRDGLIEEKTAQDLLSEL